MKTVVKRRLRDPKGGQSHWVSATPLERVEAVEVINRLGDPEYAKQAFPRVHRITRKARG
jgi:hypothetical protein